MKHVLVNSLAKGNHRVRKLLETLSRKELATIGKNPYLLSRIVEISGIPVKELLSALRDEYKLEVDPAPTGDVTVFPDDVVAESVPEEFPLVNGGWFLKVENGGFTDWARKFLLQEVRIEIWFKYIEHKAEQKEETARLEEDMLMQLGPYGVHY